MKLEEYIKRGNFFTAGVCIQDKNKIKNHVIIKILTCLKIIIGMAAIAFAVLSVNTNYSILPSIILFIAFIISLFIKNWLVTDKYLCECSYYTLLIEQCNRSFKREHDN